MWLFELVENKQHKEQIVTKNLTKQLLEAKIL